MSQVIHSACFSTTVRINDNEEDVNTGWKRCLTAVHVHIVRQKLQHTSSIITQCAGWDCYKEVRIITV